MSAPPCLWIRLWSRPTRARGLKFDVFAVDLLEDVVAPYAGAWIEICGKQTQGDTRGVAPYAGAWIEITAARPYLQVPVRRALRGRVD